LYGLLEQTSYTTVLEGDGPFTVFAPINEAFVGIDTSSLDVNSLTNVLTYHVVPGMYPSTMITDGLQLTTVAGQVITFSVTDMGVFLNGKIPIETTDALAMNGIVHKIGGVLMP
jgi:transforming growth factor-beta-induced protein